MFSVIQVPVSFTHGKIPALIGRLPDVLVYFILFADGHTLSQYACTQIDHQLQLDDTTYPQVLSLVGQDDTWKRVVHSLLLTDCIREVNCTTV
jgi:hypothetical protein